MSLSLKRQTCVQKPTLGTNSHACACLHPDRQHLQVMPEICITIIIIIFLKYLQGSTFYHTHNLTHFQVQMLYVNSLNNREITGSATLSFEFLEGHGRLIIMNRFYYR